MTYKENFVVAVKSGGKILREKDSVVVLPFESEYSILMKNLESRRAVVKISLDGENIMDRCELVINGNTALELERFLDDKARKFRFIQKTKEIVENRGDRIDDGIIRVEYRFEKEKVERDIIERHYHYDHWYPYWNRWWPSSPTIWYYGDNDSSGYTIVSGDDNSKIIASNNIIQSGNVQVSFNTFSAELGQPSKDEGITVEGSKSDQKFLSTTTKELEEASHVITIRLRGIKSDGVKVEETVTTTDKITCPSCGRKSKSTASYCYGCGTYIGR